VDDRAVPGNDLERGDVAILAKAGRNRETPASHAATSSPPTPTIRIADLLVTVYRTRSAGSALRIF